MEVASFKFLQNHFWVVEFNLLRVSLNLSLSSAKSIASVVVPEFLHPHFQVRLQL